MKRFCALCMAFLCLSISDSAGGATGSGTAVIRDGPTSQEFSDSLRITMTGVSDPASGMRYYAWLLANDDVTYKRLGALTVAGGSISFGYLDPSKENLIANYKKVLISEEVDGFAGNAPTLDKLAFSGALYQGSGSPGSGNALTYIRNALAAFNTAQNKGLLVWLMTQLVKPDNLVQHAGFAASSSTINDVRVHADHVYDFIQGQLTGLVSNGSVAFNEDSLGYGFYRYGDLSTQYTPQGGAGHHISTAIYQTDATPTTVSEGNDALIALKNVFGNDNNSGWANEVRGQSFKIVTFNYSTVQAAQADATILVGLANKVEHGTGGQGNNVPAVGGIRTAYRHAQAMATYDVTPVIAFGDSDGDGSVSAFDASLVLQHVVGLITLGGSDQLAADVDGDALVTAFDASLILQYVVGLISCFPAQPGC